MGVALALVLSGFACAGPQTPLTGDPVADVRLAIDQREPRRAAEVVASHRAARGLTPEVLVAMSWLGRGALAEENWDEAERYALQTHGLVLDALEGRALDDEPNLPLALGASIEVLAHVATARGARSDAIYMLQNALDTYGQTSMAKRIQKNINLLSLEGQPAPELSVNDHLGLAPPTLEDLRGDVVLLFFWAHWCADCKRQGPILEQLLAQYAERGFRVLAPTQRYGYVAGDRPAPADEERLYIEGIRRDYYPVLRDQPVPLSEANHLRYGVSTTPTLVIVDREGTVRLYHPGRLSHVELDGIVRGLLDD